MTRNSLPAAILAFSATNFATLNQHHRKLFLLSSVWRKFHNATIIIKNLVSKLYLFPVILFLKFIFHLFTKIK